MKDVGLRISDSFPHSQPSMQQSESSRRSWQYYFYLQGKKLTLGTRITGSDLIGKQTGACALRGVNVNNIIMESYFALLCIAPLGTLYYYGDRDLGQRK